MMTLNQESSVQRERRRDGDLIRSLLAEAFGYLDAVDRALDDMEATREDGNDA